MKPVPNVDLTILGRNWGWKLEQAQHFPQVRDVAEGRGAVAVYQDAGRQDWHKSWGGWPEHFTKAASWPVQGNFAAAIAITDRFLAPLKDNLPGVIYRPPTLTVGIQGEIDATQDELMECVASLFAQRHLSVLSLTALASAMELKNNPELIDLADTLHIPFLTYPPATLNKLPSSNASLASLCALCAMLSAGVKETVVSGVPFGNFTFSIARRLWA